MLENLEPTGNRYLADVWTQQKMDTSTGEDLELDYPGPCQGHSAPLTNPCWST